MRPEQFSKPPSPCLYCHSPKMGVTHAADKIFCVECYDCGATGPKVQTAELAVQGHNQVVANMGLTARSTREH